MEQIQGVRVKDLWKKLFHMSLSDTLMVICTVLLMCLFDDMHQWCVVHVGRCTTLCHIWANSSVAFKLIKLA